MDREEDCTAHRGILQAAKYVKQKIEELGLLETAFNNAPPVGSNSIHKSNINHISLYKYFH